jgi:hypothetical protein
VGVYRWLVLSLIAYILAHWAQLQTQLPGLPDLTFPVKSLKIAANPHSYHATLTSPATVPGYQWVYYVDVLSNPPNERSHTIAQLTVNTLGSLGDFAFKT